MQSAASAQPTPLASTAAGIVPAEMTPIPLPPAPVAYQVPVAGDELLPATGGEVTSVLPVAGLVLARVSLGVRRLRERPAVK